jgi:hypothetical protein
MPDTMTPYNEPAFPSHGSMGEVAFQGASLRDYFANHALAALIAKHGVYDESRGTQEETYDCYAAAKIAYRYADALLLQRLGPNVEVQPRRQASAGTVG